VAVVVTLIQTKQIRINKHKRNNTQCKTIQNTVNNSECNISGKGNYFGWHQLMLALQVTQQHRRRNVHVQFVPSVRRIT